MYCHPLAGSYIAAVRDRVLVGLEAASHEVRVTDLYAEGFLLTLDRGFGDVRAYPPGSHPGIIVLRPNDQRVPSVVRMVVSLLDHHQMDSFAGCITVVQSNVFRIRRPKPN